MADLKQNQNRLSQQQGRMTTANTANAATVQKSGLPEPAMKSVKEKIADTFGGVTYSIVVGCILDYTNFAILHSQPNVGKAIFAARCSATGMNYLTSAPYGMWRNFVFKTAKTNDESSKTRKMLTELFAFTTFQAPVYATAAAIGSYYSNGAINWGEVKTAAILMAAVSPLVGPTMGWYMDKVRKVFKIKSAAEQATFNNSQIEIPSMRGRTVALFVLRDEKGRILLQHRAKDAKRSPDRWAFFGGGIEPGETPKEAVRREAREELGIELEDLELFKLYDRESVGQKFVFVAPLRQPIEQLKKQQKEGQSLGLFSWNDLKDLKLIDHDVPILKDLMVME